MKIISSTKEFGFGRNSKVLVFMPHPDDEAVFVSGLLKKLSYDGIETKVVTATAGEKSTLRYGLKPDADLAEVRRIELTNSFKILGVKDFEILSFPDGGLKSVENEVREIIAKQIADFNPTHVITLEPDGIYGHPDHICISKVASEVVQLPTKLLYATIAEYKIKPKASGMAEKGIITPITPQYRLKLGLIEKVAKIRSIRAHKSQFKISRTDSKDYNFFQKNKMLDNEYFAFREN
jgi:LmbE family N-acetylglucosaminyl deacetylase